MPRRVVAGERERDRQTARRTERGREKDSATEERVYAESEISCRRSASRV